MVACSASFWWNKLDIYCLSTCSKWYTHNNKFKFGKIEKNTIENSYFLVCSYSA